MKKLIISYSYTGNNEALASNIAKEINADHIKITKPNKNKIAVTIFKHIIGISPKVEPAVDIISKYDFVILIGPIWMGQISAPLRPYLKYIKQNKVKYSFITVSMGMNNVETMLIKKTGKKPEAVVEIKLSDFTPKDIKTETSNQMGYQATDQEISKITDTVLNQLKGKID